MDNPLSDLPQKKPPAPTVPSLTAQYFIELEQLLASEEPLSAQRVIDLETKYVGMLDSILESCPARGDNDSVAFGRQIYRTGGRDEDGRETHLFLMVDALIDRQRRLEHDLLPPEKQGWSTRSKLEIRQGFDVSMGNIARAISTELVAEHHINGLEAEAGAMEKKQQVLKQIGEEYDVPLIKSKLPFRLSSALQAKDIPAQSIQEASDALQVILDSQFISKVERWSGDGVLINPREKDHGLDSDTRAHERVANLSKLAQSARIREQGTTLTVGDVILVSRPRKPKP